MKYWFVLNFFFLVTSGYTQVFVNPSFEGEPMDAVLPVGWHICSPNTTPDIFPGIWGVYSKPAHGKTYVGLITRPDGSYESIGQRFPLRLEQNQCYEFSFYLSHADTYAGFNDGIKCKLWAGTEKNERKQLLFESETVRHLNWRKIKVTFIPQKGIEYLIIEAVYPKENPSAKGNILLDRISPIKPCDQV